MKLEAILVDPAGLGPGGWSYLERLPTELAQLAIVVCTGRVSRERRVRGLRGGIDDWITKPMHPFEVLARLDAITRPGRGGRAGWGNEMSFGDLVIEPRHRQALVDGDNLGLTPRELDLLVALASQHGIAVAREDLYRRAWGYAMPPGDRSVDVFVRKLRQKLDRKSTRFKYIHTHFRVGYRFEPLARDATLACGAPLPEPPDESLVQPIPS